MERNTYPDTAEGAIQLLYDYADTDFQRRGLKGAKVEHDPGVPGCWKVTTADHEVILVYVGNHPDAPDFEVMDDGPQAPDWDAVAEERFGRDE